jgi:hypothetical protein
VTAGRAAFKKRNKEEKVAYLIYCEDDPSVILSEEINAAHRKYIEDHQHVIKAGGPIVTEGSDAAVGRVMFTTFDKRKDAENFIFNEPFFKFGRVRKHMIEPMLIRMPK